MDKEGSKGPSSAFESPTFGQDGSFRLDKPVGSASISPCGRDVVLASRQGLHIIDLDSPWSPPRHLTYHTPWEVADVQWSPFATRDFWVVSTSNQKALVWNLHMSNPQASVEHTLHAHTRAISDINFSASHPDILATCAVDSFVHCWDLRHPARPALSFCDWFAGATQVKWNRQNSHILASSHDKFLRIWDDRKGAHPLRSIEAHATKIYGVDWNRLETKNLVTCSLDKTIKFWDYTREIDEPESTICTPFPVWRARHTPFGFGLLAMPQRSDNNLHLYHHRVDNETPAIRSAQPVHSFVGHNDQVKEFLWRTRGNVSDTADEREFQLVSWGADKVLRLHHVDNETLEDVNYRKGMEVKRTMGFTRRGATYRSFRDDSVTEHASLSQVYDLSGDFEGARMTPGPTTNRSVGAPFVGNKYSGHQTGPKKHRESKDMDPITWMRGVKIGKRNNLPDLQESVSTIMSPSLKTDSGWERFESLGEEITHLGDKFSKISFDEVDMSNRRVVLSLSGPWGADRATIHIKAKLEFPKDYPKSATPLVNIEKTASLNDDKFAEVANDLETIATKFLSFQRSSLETLVRYLIGEQTLDECLQVLQKHRRSEDLISTQDQELSSSDEDDDIGVTFLNAQDDPLAVTSRVQYNVPRERTCGALWAGNGTLVCFFPVKQKEPSLLDQSLAANERSLKGRGNIFEGFGRLNDIVGGRRRPQSILEFPEDIESGYDDYSTTSSESSLSSDLGTAQNYFMPAMAWQADALEPFPKLSLDESQRSSGEVGTGNSTTSKSNSFVSLRDLKDMLPVHELLARSYVIGSGYETARYNASAARGHGFPDLADVWSLVALILEDRVPLRAVQHPHASGSIFLVAKRAVSKERDYDSGIDLSYDADNEAVATHRGNIRWGSHPFGHTWLVDSLFEHFEQVADVQMLAIMSCLFSQHRTVLATNTDKPARIKDISPNSLQLKNYFPSLEVATSLLGVSISSHSLKMSTPHSATSSAGASVVDHTAVSSESNTPPTYIPFRNGSGRRSSQGTSLSTSPEHHRHIHRSSSNFSGLGSSFSRPFSFTNSATASPPNILSRKRHSPSGSYLGALSSSHAGAAPISLNKSLAAPEDLKASFSLSVSDAEEETFAARKPPIFKTVLKNQDKFHEAAFTEIPHLNSNNNESRYIEYRKAYAQLLDVWQLPMTRCELLKYNPSQASTPQDSLPLGRTLSHSPANEELPSSLQFMQTCSTCGQSLPQTNNPDDPCYECHRLPASPVCALCQSYVRGLASPCFVCGHILHNQCRNSLLDTCIRTCPTGCGCICADHVFDELETPASPPPYPEYNAARSRGASSVVYSRDVSPAITVVADTGEGVIHTKPGAMTQREPLWRRDSGMSASSAIGVSPLSGPKVENVDVAYESLARNLRSGSSSAAGTVTPTPGAGGLGVREKRSQIWRGG